MQSEETQSFLAPLKGKVLAAFLLAAIAIALAVTITYFSFYGLLAKVDELSLPNSKLKSLNSLFERITRLDQQQRADALRNPDKSYSSLLRESKSISSAIDSLEQMAWEDHRQAERLQAMKRILRKRDYLLIGYLKSKSDFFLNSRLSLQLDSLSEILVQSQPKTDSSVTTTQKKTITTTYRPEEEKKSFFSRLFGGRKKDSTENRVEVKEEISVKTDTLAVARQDGAITEVGRIMKSLDEGQRTQSRQMMKRELDLINTNISLINQLLSVLQEVENEEIASIERKNAEAAYLVSSSIQRIGIIMLVFFLLAALLVFLILVDISRSNYYRLQLIKAKEEAEELSKVKQRFLANMSHELRTPLQSIIGFSEQLKNPAVSHEAVSAIQSSSEHLLQVVNEVLDFSRIESDTFTLENAPFYLDKVIDEVTSVIRISAQKKGLQLIVSSHHLPDNVVLGDAFRLKQILYNLLGNAVKFTSEGEVKLETEVLQGKYIKCIFKISDTGKGIAPEDISRVFDQFEQGNGNVHKQYGGSGLGLSIVKKLVDLQQGKIDVTSEPGKGTTFTLKLYFDKAPAVTDSTVTDNVIPTETNNDPGRVLLVDDDPLIVRLCSLILENNQVNFKAMTQPEKILEENLDDVHFIFLDIRMPGINGIELCRLLRAKKNDVQIVALTAHVLPQEQSSLLQSGFDQILSKPFREQDLLKMLGIHRPPAPAAVQSATPAIDLSAIRKMTMGDETLLQSVLIQFVEDTQRNQYDLEKQLREKNAKAIRELVHQLSGRVGQMGAAVLSQQFRKIETDLQEGKSADEIADELERSMDGLRAVLADVQKEIA